MKHQRLFIFVCLLVFSLIAFGIRIVPLFLLNDGMLVGSPDPYGHVQRIEMQLATGNVMEQSPYWWYTHEISDTFSHDGYLFTYIGTLLCLIAGVSSVSGIIAVTSWIPIAIGVICVPLLYVLGKAVTKSWKAGLITALAGACMGLVFLHRTLYACIDHHCLEILFSILFLIFFVYAIRQRETKNVGKFLLFAVLAGLSYGFAILSIRTCVLLGLIAIVYTVVQTVIDFKRGKNYRDLAFFNTILFGIAAIILLVHGITDMSMSFEVHSFGIVAIQLLAIAGTWILIGVKTVCRKFLQPKQFLTYLWILLALFAGALAAVFLALPNVAEMLTNSLCNELLFLPCIDGSPVATISECQPISLVQILSALNIGIIFIPFGIYLFIKNLKKYDSLVFLLVYGIIMGYIAFIHVRWELYFFPVVAILFALGVVQVYRLVIKASRNEGQVKANKVMVIFFVCAITFIACGIGVSSASNYCGGDRITNAIEGSEWLQENTPEYSELEYYKNYTSENYVEPDYTVVSEWSVGYHIIMYGHRVVLSNPIYKADGNPERDGRTITAEILACEDDSFFDLLDAVKGKYIFVMDYLGSIPNCVADWTIRGRENCDTDKMLGVRLWNEEPVDGLKLIYKNSSCKIYENERFNENSETALENEKEWLNTLNSSF